MNLRKPFQAGRPLPLYVTRKSAYGITASYCFGESWIFWAMALLVLNIVAWGILGLIFAVITFINLF